MTKKFFLFFLFSLWLIGESLYNPVGKLKTHGYIKDMEVRGKELLIGSDAGELEVYDLDSKKLKFNVKVPNIKDFMGEVTPARVFGVDRFKDRYLFLSDSGIMGYANLWIYENGKKSLIFDHNAKRALVKARLVDKDHVLYAYLGNDLALFDLNSKKELYHISITKSKFSDMALSRDRKIAAISDEGGFITIVDVKSGKILKKFNKYSVDNVFSVDLNKHIVVGGGQDRRAVWYEIDSGRGGYILGTFMIYAVGVAPNKDLAAYAMKENGDIYLYKVWDKEKVATLKGHTNKVNDIIFIDDNNIVACDEEDNVVFWKIK